jgi:hypothetical protein
MSSSAANELSPENETDKAPEPQIQRHQVWFMTDGLSPIALALTRRLLQRGDFVILGVSPEESNGPRSAGLKEFLQEVNGSGDTEDDDPFHDSDDEDHDYDSTAGARSEWKERFKVLPLDARYG